MKQYKTTIYETTDGKKFMYRQQAVTHEQRAAIEILMDKDSVGRGGVCGTRVCFWTGL